MCTCLLSHHKYLTAKITHHSTTDIFYMVITGPCSFQRHNLVNMRFVITKLSRPERMIMVCEVLSEFPKYRVGQKNRTIFESM